MNRPADVMRVEDLVSTTSLDVTLLAGASGLDREVLWAHSCEMSDPERWLGPHELLMTVGLCVPREADEQVRLISRLDDAGLAGLMIGDHETAPPISDELLAEADRRSFPVLLAAEHTPYAVVARHVAAANITSQTQQVLKLSKLYHMAANTADPSELVRSVSAQFGVDIRVEHGATGIAIVAAEHPSRAQPGVVGRRYPLRGEHPAELVLFEYPDEELDSMVLVHLLKVLEVTVDRVLSIADRREKLAARTLLSLLNGTQPPALDKMLDGHLASDGYHVAAFSSEDALFVARLVALRKLPVLVGAGRACHLALIPTSVVSLMREMNELSGVRFCVSSVFTDYLDVPAAADQALRVMTASQHSARAWTEVTSTRISVLARSRHEADEIIQGVLGSLTEQTAAATKLRHTLFSFLRNDRRWQETATELGIHRQTLAYRLKRIEQETGADLTRTSDLSAFWIAYQAWESLTNDLIGGGRSSDDR